MKEIIASVRGFSFIELLVSLIIISLITSAFSPMLTLKLKHRKVALASKSANLDCSGFDSLGRCLMCQKGKGCILCTTQLEEQTGKYVYPSEGCDYKNCSQGCQKCTHQGCIVCKEGYAKFEDKICKKCSELFGVNCLSCNETGCLKCSSEAYKIKNGQCVLKTYGAPTSQEDCEPYNAVYFQGTCITKYNSGDAMGAALTSKIKAVPVGTNCSGGWCCWQGKTSNICSTGLNADSVYSGCYRTVCQYYAAKESCESWAPGLMQKGYWSLPTVAQASQWGEVINKETSSSHSLLRYQGSKGLQLCGGALGMDSCSHLNGSCPGAEHDVAPGISQTGYPADMWTSTGGGMGYYALSIGNNSYSFPGGTVNYAFSTRCVASIVLR